MRELPILFNTEMVRAILDDRKTCTRRVVKYDKADDVLNSPAKKENPDIPDKQFIKCLVKMPYEVGDILYVRETWHKYTKRVGNGESCHLAEFYGYKASIANSEDANEPWKPSIHMPKEAARIWLKVTDMRVERLQEMDKTDALKEGIDPRLCINLSHALTKFKKIWDSTIKKSDLDIYGWKANPWVWVIEFERCEKPGKENLNETDRCR